MALANSDASTRAHSAFRLYCLKLPYIFGQLSVGEILLGASLLLLFGCGKSVLTGGPVDGVVLDATTQQPVADAMVLVKWRGTAETVHSNSVPCYHVELAMTDANGRYHINQWRLETKGHAEWIAYIHETGPVEPVVYKPGYVMPARYQDDPKRVSVEPLNGTARERLIYLIDRFNRDIMCEADDRSLIPFYQAAYEEGRTIARSPEELDLVDILLVGLEAAQYGNSVALDRRAARRLQRMREHRTEGTK